jgi:hypothetical protein
MSLSDKDLYSLLPTLLPHAADEGFDAATQLQLASVDLRLGQQLFRLVEPPPAEPLSVAWQEDDTYWLLPQ